MSDITETQPAAEPSQQVTSNQPTTQPMKNPKCVAAGKAVAERTRQIKAAGQAAVTIENNRQKKAEEPSADVSQPPAEQTPADGSRQREILTTMQWLSVISIFVSFIGIHYKREDIKKMLTVRSPKTPDPSPVDTSSPRKSIRAID